MKKKIIIIIGLSLVVVAVALYFFVFAAEREPQISYYTPGDYFVTNIKDSTRLLKATIVLELSTNDPEAVAEQLTEINHILRDNIVFTLSSKTENELRSDDIKETLVKEIVDNLNRELGIEYIQNLYFNDYVIQ